MHPLPTPAPAPTPVSALDSRAPASAARRRPVLAAWLAGGLLAACGGGGDAGSPAPAPSPPPTAQTPSPPPPAAAEVIVWLKPGGTVGTLASRHGLTLLSQFGQRPIYRLALAPGASLATQLQALRGDTTVQLAEANGESRTPEARYNTVWAIGGDAGTYATQWAPQALRLAEAHAVSTGQGVRVAVLDTGIDTTHPALAPRLARDGGGRLLGRDFVDDDADPSEGGTRADAGYGHGTHVAGLVALAAPGARLMPVRVLDAAGRGNTWVLAEALAWAMDPDGNPLTDDGAHVINLSVGALEPTGVLKTVTELAACSFDDDDDAFRDPGFDADRTRCGRGHAAVVLAAAGNSGSDTERQYPAAEQAKGSLAVSASTAARQLAPFANRGSWIGLAAPGAEVTSTVPGGGWGVWSGTSMAAPLAAGTAALVLATPAPGGDPTRTPLRQWVPELLAKRLTDRAALLCAASLRQVDAAAAVTDTQPPNFICP